VWVGVSVGVGVMMGVSVGVGVMVGVSVGVGVMVGVSVGVGVMVGVSVGVGVGLGVGMAVIVGVGVLVGVRVGIDVPVGVPVGVWMLVSVGVGVKVGVGIVRRQASWLDAAQTPAPKDSKPIANSPIVAKAKELERCPEFIEGTALRPPRGFLPFCCSLCHSQVAPQCITTSMMSTMSISQSSSRS
jgi:hypothetical protein